MQFLRFSIVFFWCRRVISVSRLDRETSGVLVAATCQEGADALTEQFKEHRVSKRYLALCTGRLEPPEGNGGWCVFSFCGWILILWNWLDFLMLPSKNIAVSIFNYQTQKYPIFTFWSQHFITRTGGETIHSKKNLTIFFSFPGEISAKLFIFGFAEKYRVSGRNMGKKTSQRTGDTFARSKNIGILHRNLTVIWIYYITWSIVINMSIWHEIMKVIVWKRFPFWNNPGFGCFNLWNGPSYRFLWFPAWIPGLRITQGKAINYHVPSLGCLSPAMCEGPK